MPSIIAVAKIVTLTLISFIFLSLAAVARAATSSCSVPANACTGIPNIQIVSAISVNGTSTEVTLKNNGNCAAQVAIGAYKKYDAVETNQTFYNSSSGCYYINPGQVETLRTTIQTCATQINVYYGKTIEDYKIEGTYGSRRLATYHTNTAYCEKCYSACKNPTPTPTPSPTPTPKTPVCDAGGPYTDPSIVCSTTPVTVALDGSKASDPNASGLQYQWSSNCPGATFNDATLVSPSISLVTAPASANEPAVSCTINLTVTSNSGGPSSSCSAALAAQLCVRDCASVINGSAVVDRCGVCEGDGQTCVGCDSVNISGGQLTLDSNADALRDTVLKTNRQLQLASNNANLSKKDKTSIKTFIKNSNVQADKAYRSVWSLTYSSFPPTILTCTAAFCVNVSTASSKASIKSGNNELVALTKKSEARVKTIARQAKRNKAPKLKAVNSSATKASKLLTQAQALNASSDAELGKIPANQSSCS